MFLKAENVPIVSFLTTLLGIVFLNPTSTRVSVAYFLSLTLGFPKDSRELRNDTVLEGRHAVKRIFPLKFSCTIALRLG